MIYLDETQIRQCKLVADMQKRLDTLKKLELIEKLKPTFSRDGNQYCYLYGEDLMQGIAGFGNTVAEAVHDFYRAFWNDTVK